ncbi:hypothetical protein [Bradyrhizobium sp.]
MSLHTFSIDDKITAIEAAINESRARNRQPGSANQRHHEILKAIAADLRARQQLPRNNALGELGRSLARLKEGTRARGEGYEEGKMIAVANALIRHWPHVAQSLEMFGEESAE